MTIVRLSGADVISVEEGEDSVEVRQYHKDFHEGDGPELEDDRGRYEINFPPGRAQEVYIKQHAGLVWQIGCILHDRREPNLLEGALIWEWLYEHLDLVYTRVGPLLDDIETEVFG